MFNLYLLLVVVPNSVNIFIFIFAISIVSCITSIMAFIFFSSSKDSDFTCRVVGETYKDMEKRGAKQKRLLINKSKKIMRITICSIIISSIALIVTPSKRDIYVLTGAYIVSILKILISCLATLLMLLISILKTTEGKNQGVNNQNNHIYKIITGKNPINANLA